MKTKEWSELLNFTTPEWLRKKKFGIYTHWGIWSVPAFGPNVTWYPYKMYQEGTPQYAFHCKKYGHPGKFGYKDLIPLFNAEKFDADEWAELFKEAGAGFAGPIAEHHDGFSMWNSSVNKWNAAKMGPKRDIVGELEKAIHKQGMEFLTAFHHAENWKFFPHWVKEYDTSDPEYAGLYGEAHNQEWGSEKRYMPQPITRGCGIPQIDGFIDQQWFRQDLPSKQFCDLWFEKLREVIDGYHPDYIYFDFGVDYIQDAYKRKFLTYYQETARKNRQDIVVSYKGHNFPLGAGLVLLEQGRYSDLMYHDWISETTVDDGEAWGYMEDCKYKSVKTLIHFLIDTVSKNGCMILNVGPKPDGTIAEEAKEILKDMGKWLEKYGEAIYDTVPWVEAEEGPTKLVADGSFCEMDKVEYTARDIRYTMKDKNIYAICLGAPGKEVRLKTLLYHLYPGEIKSIFMLGDEKELDWRQEGYELAISTENRKTDENATVIKIVRDMVYGE